MTDLGTPVQQQPPIRTIDTARLQLKTIQMSDLDGVMPMIMDPEVMKWTSQGPVEYKDQGERWLSARALGPDVINFAIRERKGDLVDDKLVGLLGSFHRPSMGYIINQAYAGKGYATEALKAFIPFYFSHVPPASEGGIGYDYIEGSTAFNNCGSQRVMEKAGLTRCETRSEKVQGEFIDVMYYRMPRPGKTLRGLAMDEKGMREPVEEAPEPPVQ